MLKLSKNGKTKFYKAHANTFGLSFGLPTTGGTCPGATCGVGGCLDQRNGKQRTCYMDKCVRIYPALGEVLRHNTSLLASKTRDELVVVLREMVVGFNKKSKQPYFRLHFSGDFFSEDYTKAWATVINEFPDIKFWVYTRSFFAVEHLVHCKNLAVYISVDPVNAQEGLAVFEKFKEHKNVALAYMGNELPSLLKDRYFLVCPETSGKLKNTDTQGACARCRCCIDRPNKEGQMRNVLFNIH